MNESCPARIIAQGRFLRLVERGGWECAERQNASQVITVVAITDAATLLLVEQFRIPLGRRVIELPAGLVGDSAAHRNEPLEAAARRELLEETGYEAGEMIELSATPSSAGLTNETVTFFLGRRLRHVTHNLGDGDENITLHEVPLASLDTWLDAARSRGCMVDSKIYAGVHLASRVSLHA